MNLKKIKQLYSNKEFLRISEVAKYTNLTADKVNTQFCDVVI